MQRDIKLKIILCIFLTVSVLTGIRFNEFSSKNVENNYNLKSKVESELRDASGDWDNQVTRSVGDSPYSIFVGDANNDGYNDIATANVGSNTVSILIWNNILGDWDPQVTRTVGDSPSGVFIGDVNNDGYNDLTIANWFSNTVSILLWNNISCDWDPQITRSVGDGPRGGVFIEDVNNDGYNDIATANAYSDTVSILLWNSTLGDWDPQITKSVGNGPYSIFVGDANNDGYSDIATANVAYTYNFTVSILLWNSILGDWDPQINKIVGDAPYSIFIGDANNDGYSDIATANSALNSVSILLWNSTSSDWDPQITRAVGYEPYSVFIGDANNDGYNDITTANYVSNTVSILLWKQWQPSLLPEEFALSSDAGTPDTDGSFTLTWTSSARANNYSVYHYLGYIKEINGSLDPLEIETTDLSLFLSEYSDGTHHFIVVAYNKYGDTLSNCIQVTVMTGKSSPGIPGYNLVLMVAGLGFTITLMSKKKLNVKY